MISTNTARSSPFKTECIQKLKRMKIEDELSKELFSPIKISLQGRKTPFKISHHLKNESESSNSLDSNQKLSSIKIIQEKGNQRSFLLELLSLTKHRSIQKTSCEARRLVMQVSTINKCFNNRCRVSIKQVAR